MKKTQQFQRVSSTSKGAYLKTLFSYGSEFLVKFYSDNQCQVDYYKKYPPTYVNDSKWSDGKSRKQAASELSLEIQELLTQLNIPNLKLLEETVVRRIISKMYACPECGAFRHKVLDAHNPLDADGFPDKFSLHCLECPHSWYVGGREYTRVTQVLKHK